MNSWRSRASVGAVFLLMMEIHDMATSDVQNNDTGMLLFHGSAGLFDLILMCCAQQIIVGRLCDVIEATCFASICVNLMGFLAYTAYAPPIFYNVIMWGLCCVQFMALLIPGDGDADFVGRYMVRRVDSLGALTNAKEANQ